MLLARVRGKDFILLLVVGMVWRRYTDYSSARMSGILYIRLHCCSSSDLCLSLAFICSKCFCEFTSLAAAHPAMEPGVPDSRVLRSRAHSSSHRPFYSPIPPLKQTSPPPPSTSPSTPLSSPSHTNSRQSHSHKSSPNPSCSANATPAPDNNSPI